MSLERLIFQFQPSASANRQRGFSPFHWLELETQTGVIPVAFGSESSSQSNGWFDLPCSQRLSSKHGIWLRMFPIPHVPIPLVISDERNCLLSQSVSQVLTWAYCVTINAT